MNNWIEPLQQLLMQEQTAVVLTVASTKGSTPREPGAKMLVSATQTKLTIGGGHLELKSIQIARNMIENQSGNELQRFTLGAGLGQCCGGLVTVFFELVQKRSGWLEQLQQNLSSQQESIQIIPANADDSMPRMLVTLDSVFTSPTQTPLNDGTIQQSLISTVRSLLTDSSQNQTISTSVVTIKNESGQANQYIFDPEIKSDFNIFLFGAGHVGQALVKLLAQQTCQVSWVDTRDNQLPKTAAHNITMICTDVPEAIIDEAPAGSYFLVMTHDHSLDQTLSEHILKKQNFAYFGLIGSATKRKRFEHRLLRRGISAESLPGMTCPVGIPGIQSKHPAAIAVSVMAQLLQISEQTRQLAGAKPARKMA